MGKKSDRDNRIIISKGAFYVLLLLSFVGIIMFFGSAALYVGYVYVYPYDTPNLLVDFWNKKIIVNRYQQGSDRINPELRSIAHNLTIGCKRDEECYVKRLYNEVKTFEYVWDKDNIPPSLAWQTRTGDCLSLTQLYCSLLYQVGVPCRVNCLRNHCWAQVLNDSIVVDLASKNYMKAEDFFRRAVW